MSETKNGTPAQSAPTKKSSHGALVLILPAVLAGAAAFGGAKFSAAHASSGAGPAASEHAAVIDSSPPGPTVALEPFLVLLQDANKKPHAMKLTIAVEFSDKAKEDAPKSFTPRIRDASLGYLRLLSYEDALDSGRTERLRTDLLERFHRVGAIAAQRVLVTDLVLQ